VWGERLRPVPLRGSAGSIPTHVGKTEIDQPLGVLSLRYRIFSRFPAAPPLLPHTSKSASGAHGPRNRFIQRPL